MKKLTYPNIPAVNAIAIHHYLTATEADYISVQYFQPDNNAEFYFEDVADTTAAEAYISSGRSALTPTAPSATMLTNATQTIDCTGLVGADAEIYVWGHSVGDSLPDYGGTEPIVAGSASFNFTPPLADIYTIEFRDGNQSGMIAIEVTDA